MFIYFAEFMPSMEKKGAFSVEFPDLSGAITEGDTLGEALYNAKECLSGYLKLCKADGDSIPPPSTIEEARKKAEQNCRELGIETSQGTFYQAIEANIEEEPVRISVSMLPSAIELVDKAAKAAGMTRSAYLVVAAKGYAKELSLL